MNSIFLSTYFEKTGVTGMINYWEHNDSVIDMPERPRKEAGLITDPK